MADFPADFDPHAMSGEGMVDTYRDLHQQGCPVVHSDAHGGFFVLSSYPELRKAASNWQTFSSAGGVLLPKPPITFMAIDQDPPEHTYWRSVFHEVLKPAVIRTLEDSVRANTIELLDAMAPHGEADLTGLAQIIPGNTICRLIGITEPDRVKVGCELGIRMANSTSDPAAAQAALGAFVGFCLEEVAARRINPREDFLSRIANTEMDGHKLEDSEIPALCMGFFFAGHHTTTAGLSSLFTHIARNPEVRDRLVADPGLIPRAAEEAVRLDSPTHGFYRQPTHDVEIQGEKIPAGANVWLNFAAGNRDPNAFENPETFQYDRKPNPHLGFGHGLHTCVGAALARMELRAVTEELLARFPDLTWAGGEPEYDFTAGNVFSVRRVPVTFAKRPSPLTPA